MSATAPAKNVNGEQGWHRNTHLCVSLKTILRNDRVMVPGKRYAGVLRRDLPCEDWGFDEGHITFVETLPPTFAKRNPHVFEGRFITVTRRDDGSLRLNFKRLAWGKGRGVERYALGVYNEICMALVALVEE